MNGDIKALAKEILEDGYLATLATNDADGPWAATVIYVCDDDLAIYWLSTSQRKMSGRFRWKGRLSGSTMSRSNS